MISQHRFFALICAILASGSSLIFAQTVIVDDEDALTFSALSYNAGVLSVTPSDAYLLCANTAWAANSPTQTNIQLAVNNGALTFGAVDQNSTNITLKDVRTFTYGLNGSRSSFVSGTTTAGSVGTLGCYALSALGVRKYYNAMFAGSFDVDPPNECPSEDATDSCISMRVASIDAINTNQAVYTYYIDVHLAPTGAKYVLRDGYNTSDFLTTTNWCNVAAGVTSCGAFPTTTKTVDVTFTADSSAVTERRIIVQRLTQSGVTPTVLENITTPLIFAALFPEAPAVAEEKQIDNNIGVGFGAISDLDPSIDTSSTTFTGLSEGGQLNAVSFTLTDDTAESTGNLLNATVTIDFNGTPVTPTVDCGDLTPQTTPPVSRTCTFDVVPPNTDFATDVNSGTYATGVSASITINATDPRSQTATPAVLPLHVASSDNDVPVYQIATEMSTVLIPDTNDSIPTVTCSLANTSASACSGSFPAFITGVAPASTNSVDELAAQTAAVVANTSSGRSGNILCALENASGQIFSLSGGPQVNAGNSAGSYSLAYSLAGSTPVNSTDGDSALCTVTITDAATAFPNTQVAATVSYQFRIRVTN